MARHEDDALGRNPQVLQQVGRGAERAARESWPFIDYGERAFVLTQLGDQGGRRADPPIERPPPRAHRNGSPARDGSDDGGEAEPDRTQPDRQGRGRPGVGAGRRCIGLRQHRVEGIALGELAVEEGGQGLGPQGGELGTGAPFAADQAAGDGRAERHGGGLPRRRKVRPGGLHLGVGQSLGQLAGPDQRLGEAIAPVMAWLGLLEQPRQVAEPLLGPDGAPVVPVDSHLGRRGEVAISDTAELVIARDRRARDAASEPGRPGPELRFAGRDLLPGVLGQDQGVHRGEATVRQDAERDDRRAADAVLAMDQQAAALSTRLAGEGHPQIQHPLADATLVLGGQVEEALAPGGELGCVVAGLHPDVYHGADAVLAREGGGAPGRKAAAYGEVLGQPVEVRAPGIQGAYSAA